MGRARATHIILMCFLLVSTACAQPSSRQIELNLRVSNLLSEMTLEEKVGQLSLFDVNETQLDSAIAEGKVGGVLNAVGAAQTNKLQRLAIERSRLQIPLLFGYDSKIPRDLHEDARDIARRKMKTKAFAKSRDERKRVEMRFAHSKTHHGFKRMRLRGLSGARDEFHLAPSSKTLKHSRSGPLGRHQPDGMHRMHEIPDDWITRIASKTPHIRLLK